VAGDDNKPTIITHPAEQVYALEARFFGCANDWGWERDFELQIDDEIPHYSSPREVQILEQTCSGCTTTARVRVPDREEEMLCKAHQSGLLDRALELELLRLQAIRNFPWSSPIRVPRLIAYVKHAENGHIVGLLREWIDPGDRGGCLEVYYPPSHEPNPACAAESDSITPAKERREKWAAQIRETVVRLHAIGVVWGDGKPHNVVIDSMDDAWLVDFGGGWTPGWVDEELADTVEGDEQAVRNIFEFLGVEERVD